MRLNRWMNWIATGFMLTSNALFANQTPAYEQIQVSQCLASQINTPYAVLAENKQYKLDPQVFCDAYGLP